MKLIQYAIIAYTVLACHASFAEQTCLTDDTGKPNRFIDHGDGTITDTSTRLRWTLCVAGQEFAAGTCQGSPEKRHFNTALTDTETLTIAEIAHWRVPNITELRSLLNLNCANPATYLTPFQAGQTDISHLSEEYMTATFHEHWGALAYRTINFATGEPSYSTTKAVSPEDTEKRYVRYVTDVTTAD